MRDYWPLKLKPYEVQRVSFMKGRDNPKFGHWLEQGIGKTLVDFADFYDHLYRDIVDCNVVIAPSYLKSNWQTENEEYGLEWPVFTWPDVPTPKQETKPFTFVINTEAMLHSGGRYVMELLKRKRCMMTVDESVCIANFKSEISKRVLTMSQLSPVHRALSGLPTPENVMQWWPQLRFCGAINGINPYSFRNRYAVMGGYMGKKVMGTRNDEELAAVLDSCSMRALKIDWLKDLPKKILAPPLEFDLTPRQTVAYKSMQSEFFAEIDTGEVMANQVVHQMMKLQQISRGFIIDEGRQVQELVEPNKNPAIKTLTSALQQVRGKTIIFTYYEYSTRTVWEQLQKQGYECVVLRGGLKTEEIRQRKESFNNDSKVRGIVAQLSVGSKGHTLLGQPGADRCSTTIYYENMYSRDVRSQSEDRNHRNGQDQPVTYIDIVENVKGSQTRKTLEALARKQDFITATLDAVRTRPR